MKGSPLDPQHLKEQEYNLQEWQPQGRITRENTGSRRYTASYIRRSFREDSRTSFKSNFTVSSTASSPGYTLKDEIDPSTYSFTTALKALQAKSGYVWECYSPEGFALNSKWDEAERYICNPLSGEVPMECLSAKTLSARSFRNNMASRVTMSAPLVYSFQPRRTSVSTTTTTTNNNNNMPPPFAVVKEHLVALPSFRQEEKKLVMERRTRDVGIQSSPPDEDSSSSSPSPASTPSIKERVIKRCEESQATEDGDGQKYSSSSIMLSPVEEVKVKVTREGEETKRRTKKSEEKEEKKTGQFCICRPIKRCLPVSWSSLWMSKRRERKIHAPNN